MGNNDGNWNSKWSGKAIAEAQQAQGTVEWPKSPIIDPAFDKAAEEAMSKATGVPDNWSNWIKDWPAPDIIGWDKGTDDKSSITKIVDGKVAYIGELKSQGSNLVDNEAYLYFQCESCNEILDPHTKSFAKLQESRLSSNWKLKWNLNGQGYKVYCVKCGENV